MIIKRYIVPIIISILVLFTSCSIIRNIKSPNLSESSKVEISSEELKGFMEDNMVSVFVSLTADKCYNLSSMKWLRDVESEKFYDFLNYSGMLRYKLEINDCDDFARAFTFFCKREYRLSNRNIRCSIAVGEFYYITEKNKNHAVNFVIVLNSNRDKELLFYDPQLMKFVDLTVKERSSCYFYGL